MTLRLSSAAKEIKYVRPIGSPWLGGKRTQGKCALFLFVLTSNIVLLNDNLTMFTALMSDDALSYLKPWLTSDECDENTLGLSVDVQCHWWPGMSVVPCDKCQQRERRRIENMVADDRSGDGSSMSGNEVAPHSDSTSTSNEKNSQQSEDAARIVVFRSAPWKVKNNTVIVRLRVTCYSSHHNEDKGFECVESIMHCTCNTF